VEADFYIGRWLIQPQAGRIIHGDRRVRVEPKVMDVLVFLAAHAGEVLSKERIIRAVWPDTFVTDEVLTRAVFELRKIFGDDPRKPRVIETIPRKGYRLIAPVSSPTTAPKAPLGEASRRTFSKWTPVWAAAMGLTTAVLGGIWFSMPSAGDPGLDEPPREFPLTTYPGQELEPTLSPDGTQVAFSWDGPNQDNFDIYVKVIGAAQPLRLTTHPATDFSPAWSPDGRSIAFLRDQGEERSGILLISPLGGAERELASVSTPAELGRMAGPILAWSGDGKWLAVSQKPSPAEPLSLFAFSTETGRSIRLTEPPVGSFGDFAPAFSPADRKLIFTRLFSYGVSDLHVLDLSGGLEAAAEPRRITFDNRPAFAPTWVGDEGEIVFQGQTGLWRLDVAKPHGPRRMESVGQAGAHPVFSRQANRLVYAKLTRETNIWRLERNSDREFGAPEKFISSTRVDANPRFSPDGPRIAFDSDRTGNREVWVCDADGSNLLQLTNFGGRHGGSPSWSPDGRRLAFDMRKEEAANIYVIDSNGGHPVKLTDHPADDLLPTWSRDGEWIYFGSRRSGAFQLWKIPSGGGEAVQVTRGGGIFGMESEDGRLLFFAGGDVERFIFSLWKMPVDGGEESLVLESLTHYRSFEVTRDGIYFLPRPAPDGRAAIRFYSFADGGVRTIREIEIHGRGDGHKYSGGGGFAVSPDGATILIVRHDLLGSDLMLVENFR
jgi:Tol biopolymer transport system component/DNA-binding winged helix-turn-helix (wHTH) protein